MGRMQREKGQRGEREIAKAMQEVLGIAAHRGRQYCGNPEAPDVKAELPGVHIEVKRTEALSLYPVLEKALQDAAEGDIPLILHRRNGREWLAIVQFDRLLDLCVAICNASSKIGITDDRSGRVSVSVGSGGNLETVSTTEDGT